MSHNHQYIKTLTVYKASAGSGKTFRLAVEYIKLLLCTPKAYEGILAVTFTNKATEEMKMRILSQLYGIWKKLPDSKAYTNEVTRSLGISEETAAQRAEKALHLLLHNYHFFRVQTIDTFFQSVLRNLAKELQLNAGLRVGLNNQQIVEQAVDELIDSISEDSNLKNIVMEYVKDNLAENKTWNFIKKLKIFGITIFKEIYKQNSKRMDAVFTEPDFFNRYKGVMRCIIKTSEEKYSRIGNNALEIIENEGLSVDDFYFKETGPISYFLKLSKGKFDDTILTKRVFDAMDDPSKWASKKTPQKNLILRVAEEKIIPLMSKIEEERGEDICRFNSAKITLRHMNNVRLLRKIEETAHTLNDAAQRFMLSDTQSLLHEIIEDGDSSFIFEKIGSRIEHVMIDEFQDTSTIQWANFKPLLHESMSQGYSNLIVGDVKQSIYRFRNGDWRLLNDIDKEFNAQELEFPPIKTNRRSDRNVVNFNNTFFKIAAELEANALKDYSTEKAESLKKAYADVEQDIPDDKPQSGLVHIEMLPHDMLDSMQEQTLQNIRDLIALGAKQKDIAILVRNVKVIPVLASYIETNSDIKVVSAEAFKLNSSAAVRIIANAMAVLAHPNDNIALAALVTDYHEAITGDRRIIEKAFANDNNLYSFLPKEFCDNIPTLTSSSLHDMAESIVRIFSIDKCTKESAYVTAFFDGLNDFSNQMSPVLEDFLLAWKEDLANSTIETTDCNGVRILTIHKSKGLEFKHVILPYCNWNGNPPSTVIWASPKVEPFSALPMVPLDYTQVNSFKGSIYEKDGYEEHIQNVVDNLNLLYVAMTRAGHSLFIIGERNEKDFKRSKMICEVIKLLPDNINGITIHKEGLEDENSILSITYGKIEIYKEQKKLTSNVFLPEIASCDVVIHSYKNDIEFRQSSESRRFSQDAIDESDRERMIRMGTILHQLFSTIRTTNDIESAIQKMEFNGMLYNDDITPETLTNYIKKKFNNKTIKDWFSDRWKILNECCIITPDGSEHRPDRVMINEHETIVVDFKFGKPSTKHIKQVQEYMELLRNMGLPNIKGFLWYVSSSSIINVKP